MNIKKSLFITGLILLVSCAVFAQVKTAAPDLSDKDKKQIIGFVFKDGLLRLEKSLEKAQSSVLFNCPARRKDGDRLLIVSTNDLKKEYIPSVEGYQYEFWTAEKIENEYKNDKWICSIRLTIFEDTKNKFRIRFSKSIQGSAYISSKMFYYEYQKVRGKWNGKFLYERSLES